MAPDGTRLAGLAFRARSSADGLAPHVPDYRELRPAPACARGRYFGTSSAFDGTL